MFAGHDDTSLGASGEMHIPPLAPPRSVLVGPLLDLPAGFAPSAAFAGADFFCCAAAGEANSRHTIANEKPMRVIPITFRTCTSPAVGSSRAHRASIRP